MGWFNYRYPHYYPDKPTRTYSPSSPTKPSYYKTPERFASDEARDRKLTATLRQFREDVESQNYSNRVRARAAADDVERRRSSGPRSLSQEQLKSYRKKFDDLLAEGQKERTTRSAFSSTRLANLLARSRSEQETLTRQGWQKAQAAAADKRQYNPTGKDYASTIYGTYVRARGFAEGRLMLEGAHAVGLPLSLVPCVQRLTRREVLFAKKQAGKGHRTPHKKTYNSGVPC